MAANDGGPATVTVRIAVAVDPNGDWEAYGRRNPEQETAEAIITDMNLTDFLESGERYYWITAELPIPSADSAETVEGTVEDAS